MHHSRRNQLRQIAIVPRKVLSAVLIPTSPLLIKPSPLANSHLRNGGPEYRRGHIEVMDEPFDPTNLTIEDEPKPNTDASADFTSDTGDKRRSRVFGERRNRAREKTPKAAKPVVHIPNRKGQFVAPLTKLYGGIGTMVMIGDPICGTAILT